MSADIDIDFADRETALRLIQHVPARQSNGRKHNSGIYVTDIPRDPVNQCAAIDYEEAEQRGYFKLDFLNMSVYQLIRDPAHYEAMLTATRLGNDCGQIMLGLVNWYTWAIIPDLLRVMNQIQYPGWRPLYLLFARARHTYKLAPGLKYLRVSVGWRRIKGLHI
jgi:hypothetical protein